MAQHDFVISNQSFPATRADINAFLQAVGTTHSGTSLPSGAVAGLIWLDTTSATVPVLKYYDGTDNITLATINHTTNTVDFNDSSISTPLTVTGNATAGAELRLPEDTDNGSNYVALKAPDTLSSNLTLTLPSAHGTANQALVTNGSGGVLSFATVSGGIEWQSVHSSATLSAVAGYGYFLNTTSNAITVTLPASPSAGNQIALVDYAGTFDTNALTINPNGNKIEGGTGNVLLTGEREGVLLVFTDATQGWLATSGINEGTNALLPTTYSVDFLVIAGGGAGGSNTSGGGGGAGGYRESTQTVTLGNTITVSVGNGGASGGGTNVDGNSGSNSSISGTGLTTITSAGGGGGGKGNGGGISGGSGGGASYSGSAGSGNTPSTSPSQGNNGGVGGNHATHLLGGGGGGATASGANSSSGDGGDGGAGTASSITGSSVTRAGGGGGGGDDRGGSNTGGLGGTGGGGDGARTASNVSNNGVAGTANTGGGGGGAGTTNGSTSGSGGAGGKGVVILSMPLARFSGTTTGSPTESTSGSNKILVFTGDGSYTA